MCKRKYLTFVLAGLLLLGGCGKKAAPSSSAEEQVPDFGIVSEPVPAPEPITATLAVCGDIMSHMSQT